MKTSQRVVLLLTSILFAVFTFQIFSHFVPAPALLTIYALAALIIILAPKEKGLAYITTFYAPSDLATGQMVLTSRFASAAKKALEPVTFLQFRKAGQIMYPDYKILRTREDRPLAAYFMQRTARALSTGRSYNAIGATGTSNTLVPAFNIYSDPFSLSVKLAGDNVYSWAEMYANELENVFKNFSEGNESNATNFLYNSRSSVNAAVAEGAFNPVTDVFEIPSVNANRSIQITGSMMGENKWGSYPITVFCDAIAFNIFGFGAKQGENNATNTSFQYLGKTYVLSYDLTAKAQALGYTKGFWFAVPDGTISVLDWIPSQNRTGLELLPQKWYSINNPIDGIDYAAYMWYVGTDSFTNSVSQDAALNYQISLDLAYEYAPLTNPAETPIQACAIV